MALSTLNPLLPALEDLITLTPRRAPPKKIGPRLTRGIRRDILLLRELDDYERNYPGYHFSHDKLKRVMKEAWEAVGADEVLSLVREMPARCETV